MYTFAPADHSAHLADALARLYKLEDLVAAGDREAAMELVMDMDWHSIADEFELVVADHCFALERYAHHICRNLQRPYLLLHDCQRLDGLLRTLEEAIEESPSLLDDADAAVAKAWRNEAERAGQRRRDIREMAPVTTLDALRAAAAEKLAQGRALHGRHEGFDAGERVAYGNADPGETGAA